MEWKFKTSKTQLDKLLGEAMVDAYGDEEQFSSVVVTLQDNLPFPFEAKVIGETVEVIGIDDRRSGLGRGVIAVVRKGNREFRVALSELEMPENFKGRKWLEMYQYYIQGF
jgi:Calcium binding